MPAPNHANPWSNRLQLAARFASMLACMLVPFLGTYWPWPLLALILAVATAAHEPIGARRRFLLACASNLGAGFLIANFVHKPLMQVAFAGTVPVMFMGLLQLDPPKVSNL